LSRPGIALHKKSFMKIKNVRKIGSGKVLKRKPYERLNDNLKSRIVNEILSKTIGLRAACRKYKISIPTVVKWIKKEKVNNLVKEKPESPHDPLHLVMNEKQMQKASTQDVRLLTEELKRAKLQIEGLQTMIEVAEEKFKIKIRKKAGTKQSRECDKGTQI
jgi:transposase-like protein